VQGHGAIHLGDVPTWVAAIGTVGTLIWVIGLYLRQGRAQERDRQQKQASKVAAWVRESQWDYSHDSAPTGTCDAVVRNDSRLPVTDVVVALLTWAWYDNGNLKRQATRLFPTVAPKTTTNPVPFNSEVPPRVSAGSTTTRRSSSSSTTRITATGAGFPTARSNSCRRAVIRPFPSAS
jgi:hypothetical protein